MEQKKWLWRRKSSEKNTIALGNGQKNRTQEFEKLLEDLYGQLSSAHAEVKAKDGILLKQAKVAEEAIAGWEKVEAEAASLKQELDDAILQKTAAEEKVLNDDTALMECQQQLQSVNDMQQRIIEEANAKLLREQEKARELEDMLAETNHKLGELGFEITNLNKILQLRDISIEELSEYRSQTEVEFREVLARLDTSEKQSASLKYEVCMLQKELEIRNEEREFNLKSAEAAHKHHLESVKKITKLETECQRLRVMVRKRLPGPAALSKMRSEVGLLGDNSFETRRKKSTSAAVGCNRNDLVLANCDNMSNKKIASLLEKLCMVEEENKTLKYSLSKRNSEIQTLQIMIAHTSSKLSQADSSLEEQSKGQTGFEHGKSSPMFCDLPLASISNEHCHEDNKSTAESWASTLISELEHLKSGGMSTTPSCQTGTSDINLMDDFLEMEKLAFVCVGKPIECSEVKPGVNNFFDGSKDFAKLDMSEATSKELVPIGSYSSFKFDDDNQVGHITPEKYSDRLQDIMGEVLQKHHMTNTSMDDILDDIKDYLNQRGISVGKNASDAYVASSASCNVTNGNASHQLSVSNLDKSVCRLVDLIEGVIQRSVITNYDQVGSTKLGTAQHKSASFTGYIAHAFLLKTSELSSILQHFIITCNDLVEGKIILEHFVSELTSALEWIINHCFSFQDVSSMKESIKKHFDGYHSPSDNECFLLTDDHVTDVRNNFDLPERLELEKGHSLKSTHTDLSLGLPKEMIVTENLEEDVVKMAKSGCATNDHSFTQINESGECISNVQVEIGKHKESRRLMEDKIENQKLTNEDLGIELAATKVKLHKVYQKCSSLEVELEAKSHHCEELEGTCLELQLQLESFPLQRESKNDKFQETKQLSSDWEISAASEKLAECQETILNLGRQLKALASPKNATLFDKVMNTPLTDGTNLLPFLAAQAQAEIDDNSKEIELQKTKEIVCSVLQKPPAASSNNPNAGLFYGNKVLLGNGNKTISSIVQMDVRTSSGDLYEPVKPHTDSGKLAIVKKRQDKKVSFFRKLLSRRKSGSNRKMKVPVII